MTTTADGDLLRLVQWLSPAFPVGGYAYSHGLEHAIASGDVHDSTTTRDWIGAVMTRGAGFADATLLIAARRGDAGCAETARALCTSGERWVETRDQGAAFSRAMGALGTDVPPVALPVAVGIAACTLCLDNITAAALYLHAFAGNLVSCAVRFVPLGQDAGQQILAALHPDILETARRADAAMPDDIATAVPGADLAAMRHETLDVRLFRT